MAQPKQKEIVGGQVFEVAKEEKKKKSMTSQEASALLSTIKGKRIYLKFHPQNETQVKALKELEKIAKEYGINIDE